MSTVQLYGKFGANLMGGESSGDGPMDLLSDTIKVMLVTSSYTPNIDTDEVKADVVANELSTAFGYTAGGATVGSKTVSYNATGNVTTFDGGDVAWTAGPAGDLTFRYAVIYDDTVATPTDPLIGYIDCGAQTITDGNTFTIVIGAGGFLTATVT